MAVLGTLPTKKKISVNPVVVLRVVQSLCLVILIAWIYGLFIVIWKYKELEPLTKTLHSTSIYPIAKNSVRSGISTVSSDQKNQFLKSLTQKEDLMDVVEMNKIADTQYTQTQAYIDSIQTPYEDLLHYLLMPPLNIWKNRFTGKIDDTLIGQKYLEDNTYLDVNLIGKRTDFFKDIWKDSPKNEIKNINIWEIIEDKTNNTFSISIDLNFVAQTKRSFLLLVDKLSTTSNKENLWLMNEFFFNLWTVLKDRDTGGTWSVTSWWVVSATSGIDAQIWVNIYKRIIDPTSTYIQDQDVVRTIRRFANCETADMQLCYFKFREKIRNLPSIAYTVWVPSNNRVNELRTFLQNIPPLMNVKWFTFRKMSATNSKEENKGYEWSLTVEAYGKSMTQSDIDEISAYLWSVCLSDSSPLSPGWALNQLERTIKQATQISQFSNAKSKQLNDLRDSINDINVQFGWLSWLKQVVKLFELYRMLLDNWLCTAKK